MGRYINQKESRTELQQRIAAELRAKAASKSQQDDMNAPDGVEDSRYIEGTKHTTSLAWVWVVLFVVAIAVFVFIVIQANNASV